MNVFGLRVCIIIIFIRITMFRVGTYLWYEIYRKSGRRDGQTNNFCFFYTSHGSKNMFTAWSSAPRRVQGTYTHLCRRMRGCWATTMRLLCTLDIIQIYYGREPCGLCWIIFEQRPDDNVIKHYYNNNENYITLEKLLGRRRCW